jgi:hypothetical protein
MERLLVPLSTLSIEPHRIKPDTRKEHYAPEEGEIFWRIVIDGKEITDRATPFAPEDDYIELAGNIEYPYFADGYDFVTVRYADKYILWFGIDATYRIYEDRGKFSGTDFLYVFDREQYIHASNQHKASFRQRTRTGGFPILESAELITCLVSMLPRPEDALYRTIANPQDVTGEFFLRRLKRTIQEHGKDLRITAVPDKYVTLNIGLDLPEFTECIVHIGRTESGYAIRLAQSPAFPVWLSSAAFNTAFQGESFLMDLNPK